LIELLVVMGIVGLLMIALGFSYEGWMGNYRLESQTKKLYFDLQDARSRAMSRNRIHWAVLEDQQYTIFEDTNENGTLDATPPDTQVLPGGLPPPPPKRYEYGFRLGPIGAFALPQTITFNTRGLMAWVPNEDPLRLRFVSPLDSLGRERDPDFDCLVIERARMWMGEYDPNNIVCERR